MNAKAKKTMNQIVSIFLLAVMVSCNVSYVPSLLYMENGLMYPLKTSPEFSEDTIINLLEKEKNPSKFKPIPPQFTLIQKTKMIYINVMDDLNLNIQEFFAKS